MFFVFILLITFPFIVLTDNSTTNNQNQTQILPSNQTVKEVVRERQDGDDGGDGEGGSGIITDNEGVKLAQGILTLIIGGLIGGGTGGKAQGASMKETEDAKI